MNRSETTVSIEQVELPPDLTRRVRRIAAERQCPVAEIVRMAVLKGLTRIDAGANVTTVAPAAAEDVHYNGVP